MLFPRGILMAAAAKNDSPGPSQIKLFIAGSVTRLSMKHMAGDAGYPSPVVKKHVTGDAHGGDRVHRMGPHCIRSMMVLMARAAGLANVIVQRRRPAGKGKVRVAFDARHLKQTAMSRDLPVR
jgi:hypothetical protein